MPDQIYRQWEVLNILGNCHVEPGLSVTDIKNLLPLDYQDASVRTVQRDLNILAGVFTLECLLKGRTHYWSLNRMGTNAKLMGFTTMQAISLVMVEKHLQNLLPIVEMGHFKPYFDLANTRLAGDEPGLHAIQSWMNKVRIVSAGQEFKPPRIKPDIQKAIHTALMYNQQLKLSYHPIGKSPQEFPQVNPLGLVQKGVTVYLVATLKSYQNPLLLVMHRVKTAELLNTPAQIPDAGFDIDRFIESGGLGFGVQNQWMELVAVFYNHVGDYLLETPLDHKQKAEYLKPGELEIKVSIPDTPQLLWWLNSFGPDVEVLEPLSLREKIKARHEASLKRYEWADSHNEPAS
ncbi:MAG: helix-turn-helix transcriptional regulator [Methylococcaceae bacterium]